MTWVCLRTALLVQQHAEDHHSYKKLERPAYKSHDAEADIIRDMQSGYMHWELLLWNALVWLATESGS